MSGILHPRSAAARKRRCRSWSKKCWLLRTQQRTLREPSEKRSCNPQKERRRYDFLSVLFVSAFSTLCRAMLFNILYNSVLCHSILCYAVQCYAILCYLMYYTMLFCPTFFTPPLSLVIQFFVCKDEN